MRQYWLPKGFFQQPNKCPRLKSTDKSLWTGFHVQVLLVFAHIVSEFAAVELWVASVFPDLFVQPNDFAHDVTVLHGEVEAFVRVSLARLCSSCFWSRSSRLHSWDSSVFPLISFITVRSVLKKLQKGNCTRKSLPPESVLSSEATMPRNVVFPIACARSGDSSWTFIKNRDVDAISTLAEGRGNERKEERKLGATDDSTMEITSTWFVLVGRWSKVCENKI